MKTHLLISILLPLFSSGLYAGETELKLRQLQSMDAASIKNGAESIAGPVAVTNEPLDAPFETTEMEDAHNSFDPGESSDESETEQQFLSRQILPEINETDLPAVFPEVNKTYLPSAGPAPLIIGHRGFGEKTSPEPENTVAAFEKGFSLGAGAVELDVQLSKDGALVLTHNSEINKITASRGCVARFNQDQLQSMTLIDGDKRPSTERLALLDDALRLLQAEAAGRAGNANGGIVAAVHIKVFDGFHGDFSGAIPPCPKTDYAFIAQKTLISVERAAITDKVIFLSFDHRVLDTIRSINPNAKVGLLSVRHSRAIAVAVARKYDAVALQYKGIQRKDLLRARASGLLVYVWTPTEKRSLADFMSQESRVGLVDGIITDSIPNALAAR